LKVNRLVAATIAFVLITGHVTTVAFADSSLGYEDDAIMPPNAVSPPLDQPIIDCAVDTGDIVGWDTSRGVISNTFTTIISDLESNGFVVREVDISTQGIPACIVKLVISGFPGTNCVGPPHPVFTGAEVSLIENYVNNGGALLIMSDHGVDPGTCAAYTHPSLASFGITSVVPTGSPTFVSGINFDPTNPSTLFQGVNSFVWGFGASYDTTDGIVATDGIFPAGNPRVVAKTVQNGCIVATSDFNWLGSQILDVDNRQLGLNVFTFLNECISTPVVGGELIPIETTSLILAGAQSFSWMIPVVLSVLGIGLFVASRKKEC